MRSWPLAALAVATALASAPAAMQAPRDAKAELQTYLTAAQFTAADLARLEAGEVIARADSPSDTEMLAAAAVKVRVPRAQVLAYYGQMVAYVDGKVTLGFGKFGSPPSAADVTSLTLDSGDLDALKACRAGRCDMRLGGTAFTSLQSIDWRAPDSGERANALMRQLVVDYVTGYLAKGDAALVTYDDRSNPVSLQAEWRQILASAALFHQYTPELSRYLERYPADKLAGARDVVYWVKESYGLKPVISVVHGVIYTPPDRPDRAIVAQKQIYASHYYDGSLAVATLVDTTDGGRPATYLVYGNRSRGDLLKGGFSGLRRSTARSQAKKAAEETLGTIKSALEEAAGIRD